MKKTALLLVILIVCASLVASTHWQPVGRGEVNICDIDENLKAKLNAFRLRKERTNCAIVMKIDLATLTVVEDDAFDEEDLEGIDLDTLGSALPRHAPRYVAYSYVLHHDDGRISYPRCFIFSSPQGSNPVMQIMYAGTKLELVNAGKFTKVFEVRDPAEINEEWLKAKLSFFS